jgi:hypothetical protein
VLLRDDFEVWYGFREATVPPPDHFEFEIHLGPDDCGEILYRPDYPSDETPRWEHRFHWPEDHRAAVHQVMVEGGVFDSRPHPARDEDSPGGEVESIEVHFDGRRVHVPWGASGRVPPAVVREVRSCVPSYIWDQLAEKQRAYSQM